MAKKQIIVEVEEAKRGLPDARKRHPSLHPIDDKNALWECAQEAVYEVKRLVNTIDYKIGDRLESEEVRNLCARADWKIVVAKPKE